MSLLWIPAVLLVLITLPHLMARLEPRTGRGGGRDERADRTAGRESRGAARRG